MADKDIEKLIEGMMWQDLSVASLFGSMATRIESMTVDKQQTVESISAFTGLVHEILNLTRQRDQFRNQLIKMLLEHKGQSDNTPLSCLDDFESHEE